MNWAIVEDQMFAGIQAYRNEIREQWRRQVAEPPRKHLVTRLREEKERQRENKRTTRTAGMERVINRTAAVLDIPVDRILSKSHEWDLVEARQVIAFILRPNHGLPEIGRVMNRHHTTILHAFREGKRKYQDSPEFREAIKLVTQ